MFGLEVWAVILLWGDRRNWRGSLIAFGSLPCLVRLGVGLHGENEQKEREYRQVFQHGSEIVLRFSVYGMRGEVNSAASVGPHEAMCRAFSPRFRGPL